MNKSILLLLAVLSLSACQKQAEQATHTGAYNVETLFTHDGCTVYRFYDGRTIYYTNCKGSTQHTESCGKNCTEDVTVPTDTYQ
jgi:hypothetical protein